MRWSRGMGSRRTPATPGRKRPSPRFDAAAGPAGRHAGRGLAIHRDGDGFMSDPCMFFGVHHIVHCRCAFMGISSVGSCVGCKLSAPPSFIIAELLLFAVGFFKGAELTMSPTEEAESVLMRESEPIVVAVALHGSACCVSTFEMTTTCPNMAAFHNTVVAQLWPVAQHFAQTRTSQAFSGDLSLASQDSNSSTYSPYTSVCRVPHLDTAATNTRLNCHR